MQHKVIVVYHKDTTITRVDSYMFNNHINVEAITSHMACTRASEGLTEDWIYKDEFDRRFVIGSSECGPAAAKVPCITFNSQFFEYEHQRQAFVDQIRKLADVFCSEPHSGKSYRYNSIDSVFEEYNEPTVFSML
ncbi:hypothetical protein GGI09_007158 [Coemansia sp. S100]|nr:hypothetical protein LPJ71_003558 [Coemansia sp. S17]KAJ2084692.1 hypothetical protein GGI09_007158 [Coemansia sp. S100]KAJ2101705.1 hypothetical protein GGI16_003377 [Coemansia sp. S142-1]